MRKHRLKAVIGPSLKSEEKLASFIRSALQFSSPPEAIFCTNNVTTIHLLETLLDDGVELPKKVAVVGFDDFEFARRMRPGITVVRQPAADLGRQAAHLLFHRLAQTDSRVASVTTILPTVLMIRQSCGCALSL
jgi:LacI family transcriptional regulator